MYNRIFRNVSLINCVLGYFQRLAVSYCLFNKRYVVSDDTVSTTIFIIPYCWVKFV